MHGFKLCKFNLNQLHQNVIHIEVGCKESGYNLIRSEDANYIKQFEIVKEDIICTENCNNLYDFYEIDSNILWTSNYSWVNLENVCPGNSLLEIITCI